MKGEYFAKLIMEAAECVQSMTYADQGFPMSDQKMLKHLNDLVEELLEELRAINFGEPEELMIELFQVWAYLDLAKKYHRLSKEGGDGPSCEARSCANMAVCKATHAHEYYFWKEA